MGARERMVRVKVGPMPEPAAHLGGARGDSNGDTIILLSDKLTPSERMTMLADLLAAVPSITLAAVPMLT